VTIEDGMFIRARAFAVHVFTAAGAALALAALVYAVRGQWAAMFLCLGRRRCRPRKGCERATDCRACRGVPAPVTSYVRSIGKQGTSKTK